MAKLFGFLLLAILVNSFLIQAEEDNGSNSTRVKRGGGYGGGHGHGPGRGGGAAGPVYFCGYVGKTEGSGYGGYGR